MYPPKSFFQRLVESAVLFALAAWLVRTGVCLIQSVWGWLLLLAAVATVIVIGYRLRKHYRDTHF